MFIGLARYSTCALLSVALAASSGAMEANKYEGDWQAFAAEIDNGYPFFELKGLAADWAKCTEQLGARVRTCRSDAEFLGLLIEAIRCLRDAHMGLTTTSVKLPAAAKQYCLPLSFMPASENRVVIMAAPETARELRRGTVVAQIDGQPARQVLEARAAEAWKAGGQFSSPQRARMLEYRVPLRGKQGERHTLTLLAGAGAKTVELRCDTEASGWPHTYNLPAAMARAGSCFYTRLGGGAGFVWLRNVSDGTERELAEALAKLPDAKGWIIDLRGNGGGGYSQELVERAKSMPKPVAVLIDAGCMSAGETLARDIVNATGARLFGETTAGASSAKRTWALPSGLATVTLPTRSRIGLGRKLIEFNGIAPDQLVEAIPEEVQRGENSVILRAEEWLRAGK
jgi:C-terminal processing protease CtpA/Prc